MCLISVEIGPRDIVGSQAELQRRPDRPSNHVAVGEAGTQLNDQQYWRYAAAELEISYLPHTRLETTR